MTKAQNATADFISSAINKGVKKISWQEIFDYISANHRVKNWMTIRGVLQWYINNDKLVRSEDIRVEEYLVIE